MRRTLSQPNLAPPSQNKVNDAEDTYAACSLLFRCSEHRSHPVQVLSLHTALPTPALSHSLGSAADSAYCHNAAAAASRSTRRSQSFKCLGPASYVHNTATLPGHQHNHLGKPNCLPPRAVMRSFLSAQGHLSSAGRLARPACSASSSCVTAMARSEALSGTSNLSNDLLHALERQGRNSADAARTCSFAHSRHSMEADTLPQNHPGLLLTPPAKTAPCDSTAPRNSIGSRTGSTVVPLDDERYDRWPADDDDDCRESSGASADLWPAVPTASSSLTAGMLGSYEGSRLLAAGDGAAAAPIGELWGVPDAAVPGHDRPGAQHAVPESHCRMLARQPPAGAAPVAMAMSSALFRPALAVSAETAVAVVSAGGSRDSCCEMRAGTSDDMDPEVCCAAR